MSYETIFNLEKMSEFARHTAELKQAEEKLAHERKAKAAADEARLSAEKYTRLFASAPPSCASSFINVTDQLMYWLLSIDNAIVLLNENLEEIQVFHPPEISESKQCSGPVCLSVFAQHNHVLIGRGAVVHVFVLLQPSVDNPSGLSGAAEPSWALEHLLGIRLFDGPYCVAPLSSLSGTAEAERTSTVTSSTKLFSIAAVAWTGPAEFVCGGSAFLTSCSLLVGIWDSPRKAWASLKPDLPRFAVRWTVDWAGSLMTEDTSRPLASPLALSLSRPPTLALANAPCVGRIQVAPGGAWVATCSSLEEASNNVFVYTSSGEQVVFEHSAPVVSFEFCPSAPAKCCVLMTLCADGVVRFWQHYGLRPVNAVVAFRKGRLPLDGSDPFTTPDPASSDSDHDDDHDLTASGSGAAAAAAFSPPLFRHISDSAPGSSNSSRRPSRDEVHRVYSSGDLAAKPQTSAGGATSGGGGGGETGPSTPSEKSAGVPSSSASAVPAPPARLQRQQTIADKQSDKDKASLGGDTGKVVEGSGEKEAGARPSQERQRSDENAGEIKVTTAKLAFEEGGRLYEEVWSVACELVPPAPRKYTGCAWLPACFANAFELQDLLMVQLESARVLCFSDDGHLTAFVLKQLFQLPRCSPQCILQFDAPRVLTSGAGSRGVGSEHVRSVCVAKPLPALADGVSDSLLLVFVFANHSLRRWSFRTTPCKDRDQTQPLTVRCSDAVSFAGHTVPSCLPSPPDPDPSGLRASSIPPSTNSTSVRTRSEAASSPGSGFELGRAMGRPSKGSGSAAFGDLGAHPTLPIFGTRCGLQLVLWPAAASRLPTRPRAKSSFCVAWTCPWTRVRWRGRG